MKKILILIILSLLFITINAQTNYDIKRVAVCENDEAPDTIDFIDISGYIKISKYVQEIDIALLINGELGFSKYHVEKYERYITDEESIYVYTLRDKASGIMGVLFISDYRGAKGLTYMLFSFKEVDVFFITKKENL
jgi:hypothetical protein